MFYQAEAVKMSWKVLEQTEVFAAGPLKLTTDRCELPDGRVMPRYFIMNFPDWVNILPITKDGQAVLVKQYRHASKKWHIEVPGGSMDPHRSETPLQGARREMLEETGYDSQKIEHVSSHYPNPALQNNQMHTFVALECEKTQEQDLDEFEDLEVYFCSLEKLEEHLAAGDIDHSIMVASVVHALRYIKKNGSH